MQVKMTHLVIQINNLIQKHSKEHGLPINNSFINIDDYIDGTCNIIGKTLTCKIYFLNNDENADKKS